ncbi:lamin tail domain-containing protein [Actinoplanes solisilvae]|uniref:lamin tail domain-containing protein n=1 Tax=Actinoplanes solisilvae TaxID=2486853 RepID=UPI00196AB368|nr:lamin tail domain-containing protein [Actinoplanes solisilvae]
MITRLVTAAAVIGVTATLAIAAPASAAAIPTLSGPAEVKGYSQFTMTGTADPGTVVHLYETAIGWNDMQPAKDFERDNGLVTATADASGRFTIRRWLDSGFYFEVHQDDAVSNRITVHSRVDVTFWVTSSAVGTLRATGRATPAQPGLPVQIQRRNANGTYTTVRTTHTAGETATFDATFTGLARGEHYYRAYVGGDDSQGVRGDYSTAHHTWVAGPGGANPPAKPVTPAAGSVVFNRIQYDSPGADSGSNGSLNGEWFRLKNRTKSSINLKGWTVRDKQNIVFTFPSLTLKPGAQVVVRTGKGKSSASTRYWGRAGQKGYVWNNGGDTAFLRTPANKQIDTCKWAKKSPGYTNC